MTDVLSEIGARTGLTLRSVEPLVGGEQDGAGLVTDDQGRLYVLKLQPDPAKARRLLAAAPAMADAVDHGWPAARWISVGRLAERTAYVLQTFVDGDPVSALDEQTMRAVLAANARQAGLGLETAFDDSAQLVAVLAGECDWKAAVRDNSPAGARVTVRGDAIVHGLGPVVLPRSDVVHGDYSSSNLILTPEGTITFVDCETVGRGTRVRDLADLYRQCFVFPGTAGAVVELLRTEACRIAGPAVFATCVVAVSYNNLAWWVEHRSATDVDRACRRVEILFDTLRVGG